MLKWHWLIEISAAAAEHEFRLQGTIMMASDVFAQFKTKKGLSLIALFIFVLSQWPQCCSVLFCHCAI